MLPLFRRKKEWLKWVMLAVILALGVTTVFMFVDTPQGIGGGVGPQNVAEVAGQPITSVEFGRHYRRLVDMYRQMYNLNESNMAMLRQLGLGQQALNQLIQNQSAVYAARELGLVVTDQELTAEIARLFSENGVFVGTDRYRQILLSNNLTPRDFEDSVRRDLLGNRLRAIVTDGVVATPDQVRQEFIQANQERRVLYVGFDRDQVNPGDVDQEKLREYFQNEQETYRIPEQRKVKYVEVNIPPTDVEVTEEQIQAEMSTTVTEEQVQARHILIRFSEDQDGDEARARTEAQALLDQLRAGADFAELARQHSEDPGSAVRGGDLGFFGRGQMVPEFERTAFAMEPNQISDLVRTAYGYHIIQTLEKSGGAVQGNRPAALLAARNKEADRLARAKAQQVVAAVRNGATFEDAAAEQELVIRETDPFDQMQGPLGLNPGPEFVAAVFSSVPGDVVGPYGGIGRYLAARVEEVQPSRIPDFEEIKTEVQEAYVQSRREAIAQEQARAFMNQAKASGSLRAAAEAAGLRVQESPMFKKGTTIDDNLRFSPDIHDHAFSLPVGGIGPPIRVLNHYFVFEVAEISPFDEERFERERETLEEQVKDRQRSEFYNAFIQQVVDRLRREEKIIINQELLDRLTS